MTAEQSGKILNAPVERPASFPYTLTIPEGETRTLSNRRSAKARRVRPTDLSGTVNLVVLGSRARLFSPKTPDNARFYVSVMDGPAGYMTKEDLKGGKIQNGDDQNQQQFDVTKIEEEFPF